MREKLTSVCRWMQLGDKSEEDKAAGNARFIQISQAYAILSDEEARRKYDLWVKSGKKRRPAPGDDMGPMPAHYRDDSVRDVQDTPLAFAGVALTIIISIGLPLCLSMQGKSKKLRRPPPDKKAETSLPAAPHVPRKERRGERDGREFSAHTHTQYIPQTADIQGVSTTYDTGVHSLSNAINAPRAITKVSGPWSPEEDAELIKAVAKVDIQTVTCCNKLQHSATHCSTLQNTAMYCNELQRTATHCNTLQHTATQ